MKKQSAFTLIELMVVMAIIAILATAGLSAYTGYIKKARDATRIADVAAINTIIQGALSVNGSPPASMVDVVTAANNGQMLTDPLGSAAVCLTDVGGTTTGACGYIYSLCDDGAGYLITTHFESRSNASGYTTTGGAAAGYHIGSCGTVVAGGGTSTCNGSSTAGTNCGDGTIAVGGGLVTTPTDTGAMLWGDGDTACSALSTAGGGWHLPTIGELGQLYTEQGTLGGFSSGQYWSSTVESDPDYPSFMDFTDGTTWTNSHKDWNNYGIRCVKSI